MCPMVDGLPPEAPLDPTSMAAGNPLPGAFIRSDTRWAIPEAFPVGSVFISVVATNPASLLGYGTWSAFAAGRVLVGLDSGDTDFDTVEETGGAKTHTLTSAEMPSHTHTQDAHLHSASVLTGTGLDISVGASTIPVAGNTGSTVATNQNTGGGGAHANLQPYLVTYMWKRTA